VANLVDGFTGTFSGLFRALIHDLAETVFVGGKFFDAEAERLGEGNHVFGKGDVAVTPENVDDFGF
jgi:hypothetical protein